MSTHSWTRRLFPDTVAQITQTFQISICQFGSFYMKYSLITQQPKENRQTVLRNASIPNALSFTTSQPISTAAVSDRCVLLPHSAQGSCSSGAIVTITEFLNYILGSIPFRICCSPKNCIYQANCLFLQQQQVPKYQLTGGCVHHFISIISLRIGSTKAIGGKLHTSIR